jgi:hypothetical protein
MVTQDHTTVRKKNHGVTNMFILEPFALPFIYLFKWLAAVFLFISNISYATYSKLLGWSMDINDAVEARVWPKD